MAKAHGLRGEVGLRLHNGDSDCLKSLSSVHISNTDYTIVSVKHTAKGPLVRLQGITSRETAEALKGQTVYIARDSLELAPGEWLLTDLVGCTAVLSDGMEYGEIVAIDVGPQDRFVIHYDGMERLVPVVPDMVGTVDWENKTVLVTIPPGMPETPVKKQ